MQILSSLICGAYHPEEEEALEFCETLASTPRKSRTGTRSSWRRGNNDNNPYAQRGLDKFSELLADLDDRRKKIYLQKGSQDITLIRFVYSDETNDCKPIIVKQRDKLQSKGNKSPEFVKCNPKFVEDADDSCCCPEAEKRSRIGSEESDATKQRNNVCLWNYKDAVDHSRWRRRPLYNFAVVLICILVFLALFGRSAAVFFTSMGWYLVPTVKKARIWSSIGEEKLKVSNVKNLNQEKIKDKHHHVKKLI